MKKILCAAVLLFLAVSSGADTIHSVTGDPLQEWQYQIVYGEKYFENEAHYLSYSILNSSAGTEYVDTGNLYHGMEQHFGLKMGLPDDYAVNADLTYVYQSVTITTAGSVQGAFDSNAFQDCLLTCQKSSDHGFTAIAGVRLPMAKNVPAAPGFINDYDKFNGALGIMYGLDAGPFSFGGQAIIERPFYSQKLYTGESEISAHAGLLIYDNPDTQSIKLICEYDLHRADYSGLPFLYAYSDESAYSFITPQLDLTFYNSFDFMLGVDILAYAREAYVNKYDKYLYTLKLTYILGGPVKEK